MLPTLTRDTVSRVLWLDFPTKPDDETRATLKANGWRWSSYRAAWYTNRRFATVPAGIEYEEGGTCDYAAERADRLEARAEKHAAASVAAYERSNAAVSMIPLGQPILVGHHSERGHRAALARSHRAMDTSIAEAKTADRLQDRAEASRRHQARRADAGKMARRRDTLAADLRKMEREEHHWSGDHHAEWERRTGLLRAEIAELDAAIAEAGGLLADRLTVKVGDIIKINGLTGRVLRVNPKSYTVQVREGWPLTLDRSQLQGVVQSA